MGVLHITNGIRFASFGAWLPFAEVGRYARSHASLTPIAFPTFSHKRMPHKNSVINSKASTHSYPVSAVTYAHNTP
jgi:hypothetical protein